LPAHVFAEDAAMRLLASLSLVCLLALGVGQVPRSNATGIVSGIVIDLAGAPITGATVELRAGGLVERRAATDARGTFRFEKVPFGSYEVQVAKPGYLPTTMTATVADATPVTLRMALTAPHEVPRQLSEELKARVQDVARAETAPSAPAVPAPAGVAGHSAGRGGMAPYDARYRDPSRSFNTEAYDKIDEGRFKRVQDDPLSTFSIDVDTASYANVRRFLTQGQLPPADAVRVEELINYFRFDYKESHDGAPFSVTTELAACPWNPRHRLALVGLQARRIDDNETPPRNLVFLLDVSGSMTPADRLPLVKTAMRMLVDTLNPSDRVAIVVYAGASGLVLPSTSGRYKADIDRAIAELQPGGSTNGAAGIQLAYDVAARSFIKGGINRVILATDGDFNVGVTSQGELIRLIEEKRERGIFLSVLGVGRGNLKDSTMEKLADRGNGNYAYLDSLHEARRVLIAEAGATLITVAKDVKIQVEFNPRAVGAYRLIGYENRILHHRDFNDDRKDAGEIGAGHTVTALYEIVPPGVVIDDAEIDPLRYQDRGRPNPAAQSDELMTVKLRYKQPTGSESKLLSRTVLNRVGPVSANLGFAAAVAEFGMLLRGSELKGQSTWASAQELARRHRGEDSDGYRSEFVRLLELAAALDRKDVGERPHR
jgi:Ca-activated chloride channel homolog